MTADPPAPVPPGTPVDPDGAPDPAAAAPVDGRADPTGPPDRAAGAPEGVGAPVDWRADPTGTPDRAAGAPEAARGDPAGPDRPTDPWEEHAAWWQEHFTEGADPEYEEQILPMVRRHLGGCRLVVEVGAGEGQVARALSTTGVPVVVGIEPSVAQSAEARRRAGGPLYARGTAEHLPLREGVADGVVACLVMEHLADLDPPVAEVARILAPGGTFLVLLNHPLLQAPGSGWIDDHILDEQYWRIGPYLVEGVTDEEVAPGVVLPFVHRPLHRYVEVLVRHGLAVVGMEEPAPPPGFLARAPEYREAATIPRLLALVARPL